MRSERLKHRARGLGTALLLAATLPMPAFAEIDSLPLHVADAVTTAEIADAEQHRGHGPLRFAVATPVEVDLEDGTWEAVDADTLRWRTRIASPGARSLSLQLSRFDGAPDAQLWIRGTRTDMTQGPYDIDDVDKQGRLWTAMVFDDTVVVDLLVPAAQRDRLGLRIAEAHHGFRDLRKQLSPGGSGSCNIDVACDQGDDWRDQARSVAGLTVKNTGFCTGNLVNNTAEDGDPLILTGHHCEFRADNAGSLVAYWNFQAENCNGDAPAFDQSQNGAALVATHEQSDHTLLRLDETPDAAFGVFYSGWDASADVSVDSGVSIHHPQADLKKISVFSNAAAQDEVTIDEQTVQIWKVNWSQGTTEAGSSGSGLWNADRQLVGVLFGGQASCSNREGDDFYGRLDVAWEGGGAPQNRMRDHLDPQDELSGSEDLSMGGFDPFGAPPGLWPEPGSGSQPDDSGGGSFWAPLLIAGALLRLRRRAMPPR